MDAAVVITALSMQALAGLNEILTKSGKSAENVTPDQISTALSEVQIQNTTPPPSGSAPGSAPGSAARIFGKYDPNTPRDLAYLLHDNDEEVYDNASSTRPIPDKYIVDDLEDYGKKCIPLKVYVSALLRTWETALLLYLPFLFNKEQPDYSQTLILEVSPFLLEDRNTFDFNTSNSNLALDFAGNVQEFFSFVKLFINLKKQDIIRGIAGDSLKQIPNNFNIILIAGNDKLYLRIDITNDKVEYYAPNKIPYEGFIIIPEKIIQKITTTIVNRIKPPSVSDLNTKYESYNTDRLTTKPLVSPPRTIYSTFPVLEGVNFSSFENIGKYGPDIFSFLKWVIEIKSHPKNTPILFVSHSFSMRKFLTMLISNLNYNYNNTSKNFPPSTGFINVCEKVRNTNTWSIRFTYLGYNVTGFRHAQSCDNMYKTLDKPTDTLGKVKKYGTLGGVKVKEAYDRNKLGEYTHLSLWGIFSTLIFIYQNKKVISDFNDDDIYKSGLMVLNGMNQQSKDNIETFGIDNELTCGSLSKRFSIPGASKGTGTTIFKTIPNFVDILPYGIPLCKMDITARQRLSNDLYSLNNIFSINFIDCESSGCKLSVKYIGRNNLDKILLNQKDIMKKIEIIAKRSVNINIYMSPAKEYILTLQHVNPGGLIVDKSGKQKINSLITRTFEADEEDKFSSKNDIGNFGTPEKIKISSDFQNAITFLMGVDIFNTNALTFDILYNSLILYSNLLIRQLLDAYQLTSSDKAVGWGTGSPKTQFNNTNTFLKESSELYGGNNDKKQEDKGSKHKKNKKHNKHNNPKK